MNENLRHTNVLSLVPVWQVLVVFFIMWSYFALDDLLGLEIRKGNYCLHILDYDFGFFSWMSYLDALIGDLLSERLERIVD